MEKLHFDPTKKFGLLRVIQAKIEDWYHYGDANVRSWDFYSRKQFEKKMVKGSFLGMIRALVGHTDKTGSIDVDHVREKMETANGEYFSKAKFNNAVDLIRDPETDWVGHLSQVHRDRVPVDSPDLRNALIDLFKQDH